ncbi:7,8-didemethyl-8-hydroxy-5-deazariboflavin synthase, CofG subunit [Mycobacterium kansasii 824]|nr:7,8-didemethyl-8-hydroxy-5-deazariboflavin synthase, CofG subunit [Mycobacterium kansasii 824]
MVPPRPDASALRRVLRRARDGVSLNLDEAAVAMAARGAELADLCASAARVRDAGLESAGRRGTGGRLPITYSRKVFIPVTHLCRDTCHYCTFVTVPGKLRAHGAGMYLDPGEILDVARRGAELGCKEALFTLGDRPEDRWPEAREWLDERGYDSTLSYVRAMAIRVLEETGLLPHLNPGVMSWSEMSRLKPVAPSMGMMLETTSRRLFETKGLAHYGSPDKDPAVRLRALTDAGRLSIPFTTGLLVGIGETLTERADTLHAIRKAHKEFGHVQEVIVQNFRAKKHTAMAAVPDTGSTTTWRRWRSRGWFSARHAHSGATEPGVPGRLPGADRRRCRRLGRRIPADARPRQPGTALARVGRLGRRHLGGRLRFGAAADRTTQVCAGGRGLDRPAGAQTCCGPCRSGDRLRA